MIPYTSARQRYLEDQGDSGPDMWRNVGIFGDTKEYVRGFRMSREFEGSRCAAEATW